MTAAVRLTEFFTQDGGDLHRVLKEHTRRVFGLVRDSRGSVKIDGFLSCVKLVRGAIPLLRQADVRKVQQVA